MRSVFQILLIILIFYSSAFAQSLQEAVLNFQNLPILKNASWSLNAKNLSTGSEIIEVNPSQSLIPASTLKTITTGLALREFGPDYRFKTYLAYSGKIVDGVLKGDLFIVGGGDPSFGHPDFYENNILEFWVDKLKSLNIQRIEGSIVVDKSRYQGLVIPATWVYQDLGNYYGATPSALSYLDNQFRITFAQSPNPGDDTRILYAEKYYGGIELYNEVKSGPKGSGDNAYVYGCPGCSSYVVRGTIPPGKGTFTIKASIPDPPAYVLDVFTEKLSQAGITYKGTTSTLYARRDLQILDSVISSPLIRILREINVNSNNLYSEHLRLELERKYNMRYGDLLNRFFDENKIDKSGLFIEDGSGLSRYNAITTTNQLDFLQYMYSSDDFEDYLSTFAIGGENGTVENMFENLEGGTMYIKSGTLSRVKAYCGYFVRENGEKLAFSVIVNNFNGKSSEMNRELETLIKSLISN